MLRLLQETEFDRYIGFAYELALDPARSGYHVYYDGMKTREDFVSRARKALERPGEDILLFVEDGELVAAGPHEELYETCPEYRKMVDLQKLEEEGDVRNE